MTLAPGQRLGSYEILAAIGKGGMGEVYRGRDTKLDREVAVKVLHESLALDNERLVRFEREAKALAALNHPNIAQIYAVEGTAFIMELVPGETLGERIKRGGMPLSESLHLATQMASALEAAHEKGIIHRDIKPGNVMVTPDGVAKVLDFGLVGRAVSTEAGANPEDSPTLTMAATQAGVIMGTAAYMAPEQAAGKPVDKRADIWSFGVVLWEMLTGERLFSGETVSHTMADVLRAPLDFSKLPGGTPSRVRELLQRCLDRDIKTRLRDIGEARVALGRAISEPENKPAIPVQAEAPVSAKWPWAAAAVLGLVAVGLALVHFRKTPPIEAVIYSSLEPPEGGTFAFEGGSLPAVSPDGTRLALTAASGEGTQRKVQLYVRQLSSPAAQPLPGTEGAAAPFWSFDSRWIAFSQAGKLKKIDTTGGPPITLTDLAAPLRGGAWNAEGVILFGINNQGPILRVSSTGGGATPVTKLAPDELSHRFPVFLPSGRFLFVAMTNNRNRVRASALDSLVGSKSEIVTDAVDSTNVSYFNGSLLYLREDSLVAQSFDEAGLKLSGEPTLIAEQVASYTNPGRAAAFSASAQGLLIFHPGRAPQMRQLVWRDRTGKQISTLGEPAIGLSRLRLSPDGRSAVALIGELRAGDLWVFDAIRGLRTRVTFNSVLPLGTAWTADGRSIIFGQSNGLVMKSADGTGTERALIAAHPQLGLPQASDVSPDGKTLFFSARSALSLDLYVLDLPATGAATLPKAFLATPFAETFAMFSPDGSWVAYASNESGRNEVYAVPFTGGSGKRQISANGGALPRWSRDGKEIFFLSPAGLMSAAVSIRNGALEVGRVERLIEGFNGEYDVAPDGRRFLAIEDLGAAPAQPPLTLVQNWQAAMKK